METSGANVKSCGQSTYTRLETMGDKCKVVRPRHPQRTGDSGRQMGDKSCGQSTHKRVERVEDKWKTSIKSRGQSTHKGLETVGDKWERETSVKSCGPVMHPFSKE